MVSASKEMVNLRDAIRIGEQAVARLGQKISKIIAFESKTTQGTALKEELHTKIRIEYDEAKKKLADLNVQLEIETLNFLASDASYEPDVIQR